MYKVNKVPNPKSLVVSCVDPRFIFSVFEFLRDDLGYGSGDFSLIAVPGGIVTMATKAGEVSHETKTVTEAVAFVLTHFKSIKEVVLIAHEACGKYGALSKQVPSEFALSPEETLGKQAGDLASVGKMMSELAGREVEVKKYISKFNGDTEAYFELV